LKQPLPNVDIFEKLIKDYLEHQGFFSTIKAIEKWDENEIQIKKLDFNVFAESRNEESSDGFTFINSTRHPQGRTTRNFSMREDSIGITNRVDRGESFMSE
jgi:hypothetical protein